MLTERLLIDGYDAYTKYGLFVSYDGMRSLLQWPQFKSSSIHVNNWHESDGLEADLSSVKIEGRSVQMQFVAVHSDSPSMSRVLFSSLKSKISGSVYHTFKFLRLGVSYMLRYDNNNSFTINEKFDNLSIALKEDSIYTPVLGGNVTLDFGTSTKTFTIAVPDSPSVKLSGYTIDGVDMAYFGMYVVSGTVDQFQTYGKTKESLLRDISTQNGWIYDSADTIQLSEKDVTIHLHLRTGNVLTFWKMWYALFAILLSSGAHTVEGAGRKFTCYYKSMSVDRFIPLQDNGIWCDFSVTVEVLNNMPLQILGTLVNGSAVAIIDNNNTVIQI